MDPEFKKAIQLRTKKSYKKAEAIFKQLIEQNPKNPEYYYHYAWFPCLFNWLVYKKNISCN